MCRKKSTDQCFQLCIVHILIKLISDFTSSNFFQKDTKMLTDWNSVASSYKSFQMKTAILAKTSLSKMSVVRCAECGSRGTLLSQSFWYWMQSLGKDHTIVTRLKRENTESYRALSTWQCDLLIAVYGFLEFVYQSTQWKLRELSGKRWVTFEKSL